VAFYRRLKCNRSVVAFKRKSFVDLSTCRSDVSTSTPAGVTMPVTTLGAIIASSSADTPTLAPRRPRQSPEVALRAALFALGHGYGLTVDAFAAALSSPLVREAMAKRGIGYVVAHPFPHFRRTQPPPEPNGPKIREPSRPLAPRLPPVHSTADIGASGHARS
jgi:hypothetical protein